MEDVLCMPVATWNNRAEHLLLGKGHTAGKQLCLSLIMLSCLFAFRVYQVPVEDQVEMDLQDRE